MPIRTGVAARNGSKPVEAPSASLPRHAPLAQEPGSEDRDADRRGLEHEPARRRAADRAVLALEVASRPAGERPGRDDQQPGRDDRDEERAEHRGDRRAPARRASRRASRRARRAGDEQPSSSWAPSSWRDEAPRPGRERGAGPSGAPDDDQRHQPDRARGDHERAHRGHARVASVVARRWLNWSMSSSRPDR